MSNDGNLDLRSVDSARRAVEPAFFDAREYLRNPDFGNEGGEGYVLMMCQDYLLPLLMARGREFLNAGLSEPTLGQEMRAFTRAELVRLEQMHWSPARAEFGERPFTEEAFQQRFESMILRRLEKELLPALHQEAVREHEQTKPNREGVQKEGPIPDLNVTAPAQAQQAIMPSNGVGNERGLVAEERAALLRAYKSEGARQGIRITDKMIAEAANPGRWHERTPVGRWKRADTRSRPGDDAAIRRVFRTRPHLK